MFEGSGLSEPPRSPKYPAHSIHKLFRGEYRSSELSGVTVYTVKKCRLQSDPRGLRETEKWLEALRSNGLRTLWDHLKITHGAGGLNRNTLCKPY